MKILVIATKFLGDLIITTPGLKALRQKFPLAEIVLLVRSEYENVLKNNPNIDKIISFDFSIRKKKLFERLQEELSFWQKIRKEKSDVFISLQPGDRIAFLAWISGAKIRIAPRKQDFGFLFNKHVDVYEDTISYLDYYNKIISTFTNEEINFKPEFFISARDEEWSTEFFKTNKFQKKNTLVCVHPGASDPAKIWNKENYVELIKKIIAKGNTSVLLIAGPKEEKIVSEINDSVDNKKVYVYNSNDINLTAALIKNCQLLITNDTGTRHLAVALKISVIALMPDDNLNCWNFYGESDNHYVITGKRMSDEFGKPFLGGISVDTVFNKVNTIMAL